MPLSLIRDEKTGIPASRFLLPASFFGVFHQMTAVPEFGNSGGGGAHSCRPCGSSLVLAKHNGKSKIALVELSPSDNGDFYSVRSAFPVREEYLEKFEPLWQRSAPSRPAHGAGSPRSDSSQIAGEKPDSAGGRSDNDIISQEHPVRNANALYRMNEEYERGKENLTYAVFPPEQVKSPSDRATFDLSDADRSSKLRGHDANYGQTGNNIPGQTPSRLPPDSVTVENGITYTTNTQGRVIRVQGKLTLDKGTRNSQTAQDVRQQGKSGDQAGHLIGDRFGGSGSHHNLQPQNSNLNQSAWKRMENLWHKALGEGKDVEVDIRPHFSGNSLRPDRFDVTYNIGDDIYTRSVTNVRWRIIKER